MEKLLIKLKESPSVLKTLATLKKIKQKKLTQKDLDEVEFILDKKIKDWKIRNFFIHTLGASIVLGLIILALSSIFNYSYVIVNALIWLLGSVSIGGLISYLTDGCLLSLNEKNYEIWNELQSYDNDLLKTSKSITKSKPKKEDKKEEIEENVSNNEIYYMGTLNEILNNSDGNTAFRLYVNYWNLIASVDENLDYLFCIYYFNLVNNFELSGIDALKELIPSKQQVLLNYVQQMLGLETSFNENPLEKLQTLINEYIMLEKNQDYPTRVLK